MNKVILMGRLTKDPDVRYNTNGDKQMCIARFSLAVDRRGKDAATDFITCVAFGKTAEFLEKYVKKGTKLVTSGRIQTGSYTNQKGDKVYTTDVVVEECEFAESKASQGNSQTPPTRESDPSDGFMNIPDDDGGLPFN